MNTTHVIVGDSSNWSGTAALDSIGESIVVELNDRFGRIVYDTITVNYFDTPSINITYPSDDHDTLNTIITIGGTAW